MSKTSDEPDFWFATARSLYLYARRWAVGASSRPEDAIIYDACVTVINEKYQPKVTLDTHHSAQTDRYTRYGDEPFTAAFALPVTVPESVVLLHRFARRYTNGRGSHTATLVNTAAREIQAHGVSLQETRACDGTIWAADGSGGRYDGLSLEERREALDALGRKPDALLDEPPHGLPNHSAPPTANDQAPEQQTAQEGTAPNSGSAEADVDTSRPNPQTLAP